MPVQRLMRYRLLLKVLPVSMLQFSKKIKELKKATPSNHSYQSSISEALEKIEQLAEKANEATKMQENLEKCKQLQRSLITKAGVRMPVRSIVSAFLFV